MIPTISISSLIKSEEHDVLYTMRADPREDFDLITENGTPVRMTVTRHFVDRGAPAVDYRPADWTANMNLRVRFYWWGAQEKSCGKCATCSCKVAKHSEDAGT